MFVVAAPGCYSTPGFFLTPQLYSIVLTSHSIVQYLRRHDNTRLVDLFPTPFAGLHRHNQVFGVPPDVVFAVAYPLMQDVPLCGGDGLPVDGSHTDEDGCG